MFLILMISMYGCSSRKLEKDYKVVDASSEDIPEWVSNLDEWIEDEEKDAKDHKYYIYTTEAKNSRATACEIAKARSASNIAAEISTFIKQSLAQSKTGDPTLKNKKLAEYVQDDLAKEVQAFVVGAQNYKEYWEKKRFLKEKGAEKDWDGYTCTSLVKISKKLLKNAFDRSEKTLVQKSDSNLKEVVKNIMQDASKAYTNL